MSNALKHLTDESFDTAIASGVVLVDFTAEWCGPCRMMAPIIEDLANDMTGDNVVIAKVDVDECQETAQKHQITSVPTIILFKDGSEIDRVIGLQDGESLKTMVQKAI